MNMCIGLNVSMIIILYIENIKIKDNPLGKIKK